MKQRLTERPILFSTPMVQAILDDRKTQTRRKMNPQWGDHPNDDGYKSTAIYSRCPFGIVGDKLWVKETWAIDHIYNIGYKASPETWHTRENGYTDGLGWLSWKWKSSLFMPKSAARIWLEITDIGVERVQDISEEDAIAEGIGMVRSGYVYHNIYENYDKKTNSIEYLNPKESFQSLWQSINGPESWDQNPFVWKISFKVLSKTGRP